MRKGQNLCCVFLQLSLSLAEENVVVYIERYPVGQDVILPA